jgi:hypothetical protein
MAAPDGLQMNSELLEALERCNSEDISERYEAFELLWSEVLNQGTPGTEALTLVGKLTEWLREKHPDSVDILEGLYGCALDLACGPTRGQGENLRRIGVVSEIAKHHSVYEEALLAPCSISGGNCRSHTAAAGLLSLSQPNRLDWLSAAMLSLIRRNPISYAHLWEIIEDAAKPDGLSNKDLYLCLHQQELDSIRRSALIHLSSRGDERGIAELRRSASALVLPRFRVTAEEAAILAKDPHHIPTDVLLDLFRNAVDLRAVHDLACTVLRKVGEDRRNGWDMVLERRTGGRLFIRHPEVAHLTVGVRAAQLLACASDMWRNGRLARIDTDIGSLFGIALPLRDEP